MLKKSAGILVYRWCNSSEIQVFLGHPGGPYYEHKNYGCWTIPKGEFDDEAPIDAAVREFSEETGQTIAGDFIELPVIKSTRSKLLYAFAVEGNLSVAHINSNAFELEWPAGSGVVRSYPEIDRADWFTLREAASRILKGQLPLPGFLVTALDLCSSDRLK